MKKIRKNTPYIKEPRKLQGALQPLFDRLIDDEENMQDFSQAKHYDLTGVKESIEREIARLFGTRSKIRRENYIAWTKNPLNNGVWGMYGIPDFTHFDGTNTEQHKPLATYIAQAIEAYEPRLHHVHVTILAFQALTQTLSLNVVADIVHGTFREEVTFPLVLQQG